MFVITPQQAVDSYNFASRASYGTVQALKSIMSDLV